MKIHCKRLPAMALIAGATCVLPAFGQSTRAAGQRYLYELTVANDIKADYSNLPATVRAMAQSNAQAANKTPTIYLLTATLKNVNPDGSADVHVSFTNSRDPKVVGAAAVFARYDQFAVGCGKRGGIKSGDVWRVTTGDRYGMSPTYVFAAGPSAGDVMTLTMKADSATAAAGMSLTATGRYDASRRLVLDLHAVQTFQNAGSGGVASSGTTTMDYKLNESQES